MTKKDIIEIREKCKKYIEKQNKKILTELEDKTNELVQSHQTPHSIPDIKEVPFDVWFISKIMNEIKIRLKKYHELQAKSNKDIFIEQINEFIKNFASHCKINID